MNKITRIPFDLPKDLLIRLMKKRNFENLILKWIKSRWENTNERVKIKTERFKEKSFTFEINHSKLIYYHVKTYHLKSY